MLGVEDLQGGEVRDPGVHLDLKENVSNALVPVSSTRHATEESSDIVLKVDDERLDDDELE